MSSSSGLKIAPSSNSRATQTIRATFSQEFTRHIREMELSQDFDGALEATDLLEGDEPLQQSVVVRILGERSRTS